MCLLLFLYDDDDADHYHFSLIGDVMYTSQITLHIVVDCCSYLIWRVEKMKVINLDVRATEKKKKEKRSINE